MKKALLPILIVLILTNVGFPQKDERIPPKPEELEAQTLAAEFFNAYRRTQDIGSLVEQFFIKDFETRLKNCRTSGGCGGFGRDFWGEDEELSSLSASADDHLKRYVTAVNYLFLYSQCYAHLARIASKPTAEYEQGEKILDKLLRGELKENSAVLKLGFFGQHEDRPVVKSLAEFHELQSRLETLVGSLRVVERNLQAELLQKFPKTILDARPKDFRVYKEPNREGFFGYAETTQMYDVWPETDGFFLKIDMIREKGTLRIVAVYPPMD